MAEIKTLGPVGLNPNGEYDGTKTYEKLDVVLYQGSSYVALKPVQGIVPTNPEYWQKLVSGGIGVDDIVDNLESNDSTKVLSARQGKIIGDKIKVINDEELKVAFLSSGDNYADSNSHWLGDNIVITGKENIIIDFGRKEDCEYLINYLTENNINKIHKIIISHYHTDHIGGANAVGLIYFLNQNFDLSECTVYLPHKNIDWDSLYGSASLAYLKQNEEIIINKLNEDGINYKYCDNQEIVSINENFDLKFLNTNIDYTDYYTYTTNWDLSTLSNANYNNFSMVVELRHFNNYFLFAADIEPLAQSKIYPYIKHCDVLKVEHHSLNYDSNSEYLEQLNPKIAIVTELDDLTQQSLTRPTVSNLKLKGTRIYSTHKSGNVIVESTFKGINVKSDNETMDINEASYNLHTGFILPANTDLNNVTKVGVYQCESGNKSTTITNNPLPIAGFKLIVEKPNNYGRLKQTLIESNTEYARIWVRNNYGNNLEWTDWLCLEPSEYVTFGSDELTPVPDITFQTPLEQNRVVIKNGVICVNLDIKANEAIAAYSELIKTPGIYNLGNQTAKLRTISNFNFILFSDDGTAYPCYARTINNVNSGYTPQIWIRTRKAIPSGTVLRGTASSLSNTYSLANN